MTSQNLPASRRVFSNGHRHAALRATVSLAVLAGICLIGMGGEAAANCTAQPVGSNTYICSGATTTVQSTGSFPVPHGVFTTDSTYSVILSGTFNPGSVAALQLWGNGSKTYIDTNAAVIDTTAALRGTQPMSGVYFQTGTDLPGDPAGWYIRSNGTFRASGDAITFVGLGGLPESGYFDVVFTGTIQSVNRTGLSVFTPGLGANVSVNNVSGMISAVVANFGGSIATEAATNGDMILNTNGLISGQTNIFGGGSFGVLFSLYDTAPTRLAAGTKVILNIAPGSIVEGATAGVSASGAIATSSGGTPTSLAEHPVLINNDGIIRNISGASDAAAILVGNVDNSGGYVSSARLVINNRNLLVGTASLGIYDDLLTNTGTWNTANGINDFGGGNNTIDNRNGAMIIAANDPNNAQITTFNGLGTFTNAGVITMQDGFAGDRMVVTGNYIGQGGTIRLDTFLGNDNSASDRLVLNGGSAAGATLLAITNTTGNGALTVADGIMVVQATNGATTAEGAFFLAGRLATGAYEYLLFHGGQAATGGDPNDQNWYLRNTFTPEPGGPVVPIIRPEVPVSMVIPPLALEYGYAMLDTLHERVGETWLNVSDPVTEERVVWCKDSATNFKCKVRVPAAKANAGKDETRWTRSGWARLIGDRGFHDNNNFMKRGPDYNYTFGGIQAGLDIYAREQADGTLDKAGIYVGYGQILSDVKGQFGAKAGSVDMDAYTLGGYWTHHSSQGWYTDAVIQGTWYAADAKSVYGQSIKPDGFGILGSLEAGYAFKLGNGFTLEPQAQIVYQSVSFDNAKDAFGFVNFDDGESLRGRLGLRLTKTWNTADQGREPRLVTAWLRANVWHEFMGKTKTSWGSLDGQNMTPFHSYLGGTWGELGAGVTAQVSDKINLFATGAYNRSLDNKGREGWDGRLGMTVKW